MSLSLWVVLAASLSCVVAIFLLSCKSYVQLIIKKEISISSFGRYSLRIVYVIIHQNSSNVRLLKSIHLVPIPFLTNLHLVNLCDGLECVWMPLAKKITNEPYFEGVRLVYIDITKLGSLIDGYSHSMCLDLLIQHSI